MEFIRAKGEAGARQLAGWDARRSRGCPEWASLRAEMEALEHRALYDVTPQDMAVAFDRTEHALGRVKLENCRVSTPGRPDPQDWSPPVPFHFVWHSVLEDMGRFPLWQDVWTMLTRVRPELVAEPFRQAYDLDRKAFEEGVWADSFRWRVGNSYYSFFRETELLVRFRRLKRLDVRYHFLADAEWRADMVAGDILVAVSVINPAYRSGSQGRKVHCSTKNPGARVLALEFTKRNVGGKPWLVYDHEYEAAAVRLAEDGCPRL